jgi:hypothetical protein
MTEISLASILRVEVSVKKLFIISAILAGILAISFFGEVSAASKLGAVKTKFGSVWGVSGQDYKAVTIFKGIPYAAPPVGDLRWKPPQDPKLWDGIRVCDTYAAASWQPPGLMPLILKYSNKIRGK